MGAMHENPAMCASSRVDEELRPEELFDDERRATERAGRPRPVGTRRMSANPHTNGGVLLRDLRLPDFRDYAVTVPAPGPSRPSPPGSWARSCAT